MKIKLPTVEFYAWMWLAALIFRSVYSILLRAHFGDFPATEIAWLILPQILVCGGFLAWRKKTEKKRNLKSDLWNFIWKQYKLNPVFWIFEVPRKIFVQIVLVGTLCHSLYLIACSTSLMTSMALCSFRLYDKAEVLYTKTPWPITKRDRTFIGVWDGIGHADLEIKVDHEINNAIARVYGLTSPQMGYRLYLLGKQYRSCAVRNLQNGDMEKAKALALTSIEYSSWAYDLLNSEGWHPSEEQCLKNISLCREILGRESAFEIVVENFDHFEKRLINYRYFARLHIVKNLIENEPGRPYVGNSAFYSDDYHLGPAETIAVLFPIFFLASCYGCSGPLFKKVTVLLELICTKRILESTLILEKRFECMSKLSLLLLCQGKIDEAEMCSRKMLALAEAIPKNHPRQLANK